MSTTTATPPTTTSVTYAGFGARLVAMIIDYIIIWVIQAVVITPVIAMLGFGIAAQSEDLSNLTDEQAMGLVGSIIATAMSVALVIYCIAILYFAIMESSKLQASVGKLALGIKVTDMDGNRVSFGKALLRSIGKIISGMIIYIGYIMAAFTEKKQGLHDMIASTLVLKK